ncbi:MAG: hypothetical protein CMF49_07665 [Legionellales bacterium]|nr:hypothetical protein [Legionellales bacterium]|tara:strand:- start:20 stop:772 length:753 start_codon:yes stop_codon:yes gene_type:complete
MSMEDKRQFIYKLKPQLVICWVLLLKMSAVFAGTNDSNGLWAGINIENRFQPNSKWHYNVLVQPRFINSQVMLQQVEVSPAIFYQQNQHWSYWLGYGLFPTTPQGTSQTYLEQRIWPQIEYDTNIGDRLKLSARSRYEIRQWSDSAQIATRFRQRFEATVIGHNALNISYDAFYEGFLNVKNADWVTDERVDQNRYYLGIEIPTTATTVLNFGYLYIYRPREVESQAEHIFSIGLSVNLDKRGVGPVYSV